MMMSLSRSGKPYIFGSVSNNEHYTYYLKITFYWNRRKRILGVVNHVAIFDST